MRDLKINEIIEITGGDEPAYGIGYLTGQAIYHNGNLIGSTLVVVGETILSWFD